jgi:hypothetical protein
MIVGAPRSRMTAVSDHLSWSLTDLRVSVTFPSLAADGPRGS